MKKYFLLFGLLCACAKTPAPQPPQDEVKAPECPQLHVIMPSNFIIDLTAGSEVELHPSAYEFVVYCDRQSALAARDQAKKNGQIPPDSEWTVYTIAGDPAKLAKVCHETALCLAEDAVLESWLEENPKNRRD